MIRHLTLLTRYFYRLVSAVSQPRRGERLQQYNLLGFARELLAEQTYQNRVTTIPGPRIEHLFFDSLTPSNLTPAAVKASHNMEVSG
jgi:hypothetical protein